MCGPHARPHVALAPACIDMVRRPPKRPTCRSTPTGAAMTTSDDPIVPGTEGDGRRPPPVDVVRVEEVDGPNGTLVILRGWETVGDERELTLRFWRAWVRNHEVSAAMLNGQPISTAALPGLLTDLAKTVAQDASARRARQG
jgi:hypothetical protein